MSRPLEELTQSQLNKKRQASIFDYASPKRRKEEYPLSPPSSSPLKCSDPRLQFSGEKLDIVFELPPTPAYLRSGINTLSRDASFLTRLQWKEMSGLLERGNLFKQPHRYEHATASAIPIEDCDVPVLCGSSARSLPGLWLGTQQGKVISVGEDMQATMGPEIHNNAVLDICAGAGSGELVATASGDKSVILWDAAQSGQSIRQYKVGNGASVRKIATHTSTGLLAAVSRSGTATIIDWRAQHPIKVINTNAHYTLHGKGTRLTKAEREKRPGLTAVEWITDTTFATASDSSSEVRIWDTRYLSRDGPSGINGVEGKATRPVALFGNREKAGVTALHYDTGSRILYSISHKTVSGYSCDYGDYADMNVSLVPNFASKPPVVSAAVQGRTFYSGSAIRDGYLAVGENAGHTNIFSLPDSIRNVQQGLESVRIFADSSGHIMTSEKPSEIAALSWVGDTLMGCTDLGVAFQVDEAQGVTA